MPHGNDRVFDIRRAGKLEGSFRKIVHNPKRMLGRYVTDGITALDFGCGPGFFTIPMAGMVGERGRVIAADLQQGMLDILKKKVAGKDIESRIILHKVREDSIGIKDKVDFVLAFYVVHEVPSVQNFFREMKSILKPGGKMLVVEPNFKVSEEGFEKTIMIAGKHGFIPLKRPGVMMSRAAVLGLPADT